MRKNKDYWMHLVERYFEAETTREEELALRRFLATNEADAPEFEEARAVMGYLAVGRSVHKSGFKSRRRQALWWAAAAAVVVLVALPLKQAPVAEEEDICVAYVDGKRLTDSNEVLQLMKQTMQSVQADAETRSVENRLGDIFNTLN